MPDIEELAAEEFRPGVSSGAAARQLCRSLDPKSPLRLMLEDMLAKANRASHDRYMILEEFKGLFPEAGLQAELKSYKRINDL